MPARFEFRLQPLLDARKRLEAETQRNVASQRRALEGNHEELDRLAQAWRREMNGLTHSAGRSPAADLRLRAEHLSYLEGVLEAARRRRAALEVAYEQARQELIAASRERRVIEKLKERRRRAYEIESARREELELDDANARRHERAVRDRLAEGRLERAAP